MSTPDELERMLIAEAERTVMRSREQHWSDPEWTRQLISSFGVLGCQNGYFVCGRGCNNYGGGEWLYDLVWLQREDGQRNQIRDVPLILESEWHLNFDWILEDFQKLLVGRARHHVMIFQQVGDQKVREVYQKLTDHELQNWTASKAVRAHLRHLSTRF